MHGVLEASFFENAWFKLAGYRLWVLFWILLGRKKSMDWRARTVMNYTLHLGKGFEWERNSKGD